MILGGVFIGSGSLLVACAEIWLAAGNRIHGVVSDCPTVTAWCNSHGAAHIHPSQDQPQWLGRASFDYLFSVVNHSITPPEVLALPTRRALNYHDSLLPQYAGFNATSWAIMDGQPRHGVTWHQMSADVDGGGIAFQQPIEISDDDTGFSLGAKCSEAGLTGFRRLVEQLVVEASGGGALPVLQQGPQTGFHFRSDRPGLGIIDFRRRAAEVTAFVRALDLGSDDNWMCRPKLVLPSGQYIVGEAVRVSGNSAPGVVTSVDAGSITIAAQDGAIRCSRLTTLEGAPVDPSNIGLAIGGLVPPQTDTTLRASSDLDKSFTKNERFWVRRLETMTAPSIPGVKQHAGAIEPALLTRRLSDPQIGAGHGLRELLLAGLAAYTARVGESAAFDLGLSRTLPADLAGFYSDATPMRMDVDLGKSFAILLEQAKSELALQDRRGPYARDVVTRYRSLRRAMDPMQAISVGLRFGPLGEVGDMLVRGASITLVISDDDARFHWVYDRRAISDREMMRISERVETLLANGLANRSSPVGLLDLLETGERKQLLADWQNTAQPYASDRCIHELFEAQVARTPDATAAVFQDITLTYRELDRYANGVAEALRKQGVGPDTLVAVCLNRSLDLIVGLMGVLKAGGAYVPLDPAYPRERLGMMLEDCGTNVLLTQRRLVGQLPTKGLQVICIEDLAGQVRETSPKSGVKSDNLAYVIFTSGSTGRPKGVMVKHDNVSNFFTGMDARLGDEPGVWLAVTSVSFDISVLELFWTLTRGFEVVIQSESDRASLSKEAPIKVSKEPMAFGLFYFAADQGDTKAGDAYRLLLEGAKFADTHDFSAVWTPERHFHAFGGLYPNPAVTTAAVATITKRVALRAGSVVLPLHNPMRVAEDWSVIDLLSNGRVGLSFASGWHADDFAFMPENYERRREVMVESIDTVLKLWRGEKIEVKNGQGKTISVSVLPRPIQAAPPIWIASAGSVDTFKLAGRLGANVLTNMLGQDIDDLRSKFAAYRASRSEAGYEGPGNISVMLHTFVCDDTEKARELARKPFCDYLTSSFDLIKVAPSMFPAFRQPSLEAANGPAFDASRFTPDDMGALMEHAFDRYFETAGLFGTPEKALGMIERLKAIGANEVACLVDFGIDPGIVLDSLPHLDRLRQLANSATDDAKETSGSYTIAEQIGKRHVTHLQCTPSMARILANEPESLAALEGLKRLMLGGEALPTDLLETLLPVVKGQIHNMYGPTETTIWSTTSRLRAGEPITIGRPIANTVIRTLDVRNQQTPIGVPGELCIGGAGVASGYLGRPDLTAERFIKDPYDGNGILYRTGDLARFGESGDIEFLGRLDHQVKINGYRIELGEIEAVLARHPSVRQNVVVARSDGGAAQLVGYVISSGRAAAATADTDRVSQWQSLWNEAYIQGGGAADPRFNIAGWNSSYTGAPIPEGEMREWLDGVEHSIRALSPKRILEIGCGVGMVLYRLLPHAERYTAIDLSSHALETIRKELTAEERAKVTLMNQPAHALAGVASRSCDTVVINSVAQYFPDSDYLAQVLKQASELVEDGGRIFIGDVRSREHLIEFHTVVAVHQAPAHVDGADLARRIEARAAHEGELVLSDAYFHALAREMPRVTGVDVRLKSGRAMNEMNVFRYDVVLQIGKDAATASPQPAASRLESLEAVREALSKAPPVLVLEGLKNARLSAVAAARAAISSGQPVTAGELREIFDKQQSTGVNPAELLDLNPDYAVDLMWARSGDPARFDAVLRHKTLGPRERLQLAAPANDGKPSSYANQPAHPTSDPSTMFDDLRAHLREFLPEYMIPTAFVAMEALPLTPNGKIDRKALPAPMRETTRETPEYVAPSNALEETIAGVWRALLGLERVGMRDNIFDLGATSLLTAQANQRLSALLGRRVPLVAMFRYPSIETLATHLDEGRSAAQNDPMKIQEQADRKKDAAQRRRELRGAMPR